MNEYAISDLLKLLLRKRGDRLCLEVGLEPVLSIKGEDYEVQGPVLEKQNADDILRSFATTRDLRVFRARGAASFFFLFGNTRFAVRVTRVYGRLYMELRAVKE